MVSKNDRKITLDFLVFALQMAVNIVMKRVTLKEEFLDLYLMNSMKLVISIHSVYWSIHTKDESKRETAFAFIFGVN